MDREKRLQQLQVAALLESMFPSGPPLADVYFSQHSWSLKEFCALANRLRPEDAANMPTQHDLTDIEIERISDARDLYKKLSKHAREISLHEGIQDTKSDLCMSPWKFVKWCAHKKIDIPPAGMKCFPTYLLEIFLEHNPLFSPLRTHSPHRREYQEAFYLKNALKIKLHENICSNIDIYNHPHMQNVLQHINKSRKAGSKDKKQKGYSRKTLLTSWLPKLEKRGRGRPRKNRA